MQNLLVADIYGENYPPKALNVSACSQHHRVHLSIPIGAASVGVELYEPAIRLLIRALEHAAPPETGGGGEQPKKS